jgi:hypothetical protein
MNLQLATGITWISVGWVFFFGQFQFFDNYLYIRLFTALGFVLLGYLILPKLEESRTEVKT